MDSTAEPFLHRKGRQARARLQDSLATRLIVLLGFVAVVIWAFNIGLALQHGKQPENVLEETLPMEAPPVKAQAAEATPPVTEPSPRPRFAVQVGAYEDRAFADNVARSFSSYYPYVLVSQRQVGGKVFHQVRIPVATEAEAKALAARLKRDAKIDTWVVPLP